MERSERTQLSYYLKSEEERGLESSRLEMETPYPGGNNKLSCRAVQYDLYSRTQHVYLSEDAPLLAHVLGPTSSETGEPGSLKNIIILNKHLCEVFTTVPTPFHDFFSSSKDPESTSEIEKDF